MAAWRWISRLLLVVFFAACCASAAFAVLPDEVLKDPALEARARALSQELRCMVCQNQSIDDFDAPLARDLRVLVRERIAAGDSNDQVRDFLVARYGEFVLLKPRVSWRNAALWAAPFAILLAGGIALIVISRRRYAPAAMPDKLTADEQRRLDDIARR